MARTKPFDRYLKQYEKWFEENSFVYESEVEAIRHFIPKGGTRIEIGMGTGRFALPLDIREGVEPSTAMRKYSAQLGLQVYDGTAENLPIATESYDLALIVTTICFVDDVGKALGETWRILKPGSSIIIGLVDKDSPLGKTYEKMKDQNKFYKYATFYSTDEVKKLLERNSFGKIEIVQTVFGDLSEIREVQQFKEGYGEGGFVSIKATKEP